MGRLIRGLRGHPGVPILVCLVVLGAAAGARGGSVKSSAIGALVMLIVFGTPVVITAWNKE